MNIEEIKIMLGDTAANFTEAQIALAFKCAVAEIEAYCNRELDSTLELMAEHIAIVKLNRINTEGLSSVNFSGISESYINGYPSEIIAVLNRKRKVKFL